ncbi:MAG: hypothetical protein ACKON9_07285, partial [Planctomycetaceae bacterium]
LLGKQPDRKRAGSAFCRIATKIDADYVSVTANYSYAEFCDAFSSPFGDWSLVCTVVVTSARICSRVVNSGGQSAAEYHRGVVYER